MRWRTVTRWMARTAATLSIALSGACLLVSARSRHASDGLEFISPYGNSVVYTCDGGVAILTQPYATPSSWEWIGTRFGDAAKPYQPGFGPGTPTWFGSRYGSYFTSMKYNAWALAVPLWLLSVLAAAPVGLILLLAKIVRLRPRGQGFPVVGHSATA